MLGGSTGTVEVLQYARQIGVHTVVADYIPTHCSAAKQIADEAWLIDVADLDALESICRSEHVTAVFAATSEFCLDQAKTLCERLGLPFYASEEGWRCSRDKERFKQVCSQCGAAVPTQYVLNETLCPERLKEVSYPVIVKPVDSSAQQGLSWCRNEQELKEGYHKARQFSRSGRVLVEEYVEGTEVGILFFLSEGRLIITATTEALPCIRNGRPNFGFGLHRSRFHEEAIEKERKHLEDIMSCMNCRNGMGFVQTVRRDGVYHYLEFGYRLDGVASWTFARRILHHTPLELMVELALGHKLSIDPDQDVEPDKMTEVSGGYPIWAKPGRVVRVEGLEAVKALDGVTVFLESFHAGDTIEGVDNMRQIAYSMLISARDYHGIGQTVAKINHLLRMIGEDGENLLIPYTDFEEYLFADDNTKE